MNRFHKLHGPVIFIRNETQSFIGLEVFTFTHTFIINLNDKSFGRFKRVTIAVCLSQKV